MKQLRFAVASVAVGLLVTLLALQGDAQQTTPVNGTPSEEISGLFVFDEPSYDHSSDPVVYPQDPPAGGPHSPTWQTCGFYDEPIGNEHAVHSQEHGAVWITYQPGLPEDQLDVLRALAEQNGYILVSPYSNLPAPVVASAWGAQIWLDGANDPRLEQFITRYANNGPEAGAPCTGGTDETVPWATPGAGTAVASPTT